MNIDDIAKNYYIRKRIPLEEENEQGAIEESRKCLEEIFSTLIGGVVIDAIYEATGEQQGEVQKIGEKSRLRTLRDVIMDK